MAHTEDPNPAHYYPVGIRTTLFSQGDIFELDALVAADLWTVADVASSGRIVPPNQDMASSVVAIVRTPDLPRAAHGEGRFAMLTTPTDGMRARGATTSYTPGRLRRTIVPIVSRTYLVSVSVQAFTEVSADIASDTDHLDTYMFLPTVDAMPTSFAVLDEPAEVHHRVLEHRATRIAQLTREGTQQLQRKLVWYATYGDVQMGRAAFNPPNS
jgi:hypothetical protein